MYNVLRILAFSPPPFLQAAAVALMPRMAQQELGNTVWALAVMDLLDLDTWERFCGCLNTVEGEWRDGLCVIGVGAVCYSIVNLYFHTYCIAEASSKNPANAFTHQTCCACPVQASTA
jgi:hypothetical protein